MRDEQIEEMVLELIETYLDQDFLAAFSVRFGEAVDVPIIARKAAREWLTQRAATNRAMVELGLVDDPIARLRSRPRQSKRPKNTSAKRKARGGSSSNS